MSSETRRYADFYDKLFRLQEEVFAGKHPRIKLPDSVLEQVAPRPLQSTPSSSVRPTTNGTTNGTVSHSFPTPPRPDSSSFHYPPPAPFVSHLQNTPQPFQPKPTSSGIDPVLLTKSDDLIRAELQLKRQRIERVLKDQVDKRGPTRDKDLGLDSDSRFDVDELLTKALERVPAVSGLQTRTNRNSDTSDSFDENSYYSSQANSWSSEDVENPQTVINADAAGAINSQGKSRIGEAAAAASKASISQDTHSSAGGQDEDYEPGDDLQLYETAAEAPHEEREESDYSPPPAADASTAAPLQHGARAIPNSRGQRHNSDEVHDGMNGYGYNKPPSPTSAVPVIRNHIRSPVAPQPARVSPLAFAKVPRMDQDRQNSRQENGRGHMLPKPDDNRSHDHANSSRAEHASPRNSRRQSPVGHQQNVRNPRKRRREPENGERRGQPGNKRVARSPEPYIKEEPVSPPPFGSYSDPQPTKRRAFRQLPDDVEIVSARDTRAQPVYYRDLEQPPRTYRHHDEPPSPTVIRVPSRTGPRRLERDDQDLRRVASLQYARRPYSPVAPEPVPVTYSPSDSRHIRAASHAFVDRSMQPPIYREGSVRPSRYVRERSRTPIHEYVPRAHTPLAMAPPPRQVVVDQYGKMYFAEPASVDRRESVAPPSRRVEVEPYYEHAVTREPLMRAPLRAADPYEEDNTFQRMHPPARRYVEQSDVEIVEPRSYRQGEYALRPSEAEYAPIREVVDGRPVVHYEEMPPPREYVRSFSVRPEVVRREAPSEYITPRHESVQPGYVRRGEPPAQRYREVSVQGDPYGAADDRRYAYAPPQPRRYVDDQGVVERPVEIAQEPYRGETRRVSYRY